MTLTTFIGTAAAVCTTGAFIPQIIKLRKQGGKDLSYQMLFLYLTGVLLWLVYGIQVHAKAVIWANALAALMVLISIILKANPPAQKLKLEDFGTRRLRIAIDMDEVIADSFARHLSWYNQRTGRNLTPELVSSKGLSSLIPHDRWEEFAGIPHEDGFFDDLEMIPGSQEALLELARYHDVYIASAAMEVPSSFDAKYKWLRENFPFIPTCQMVFCGDKNVVNADILVDDRSRHFAGFRGQGILFTAPHNVTETQHLRANNWNEVLEILNCERRVVADDEPLARTLSMNPAG